MRIGVKLLDEQLNIYRTFRLNALCIKSLIPISEGDIDKGTHIVDTNDNLLISNEPIDVIELRLNELEEKIYLKTSALLINHLKTINKPKRKKRKKL